ncbi:DEAD/DEAH box helicase family protein [Luteolibacter pohnpeiensis]|uniref:DEAD/DEAH box helicase family protein n=1 Tax=Luteolibacter pohnpeiensis TaxID=454153 RepID=A0A934VUR3_9BACT|nr:helicase-related protein [Luteolibacter pohnpeiensis]MBK1881405.1 DEAD/DEAH box helicase family protein [Luteolibacter pohnpeiensis]
MHRPSPGQRWISTSEPALGLGLVKSLDGDRVEMRYPAAEETRIYALETAPLVRVQFAPGDLISGRDGTTFSVTKVTGDEILTYHGESEVLEETELLDSLTFIRPEKRLLAGLTDHPRDFDQRLQALEWNSHVRQSPARGFTGARIDLIPHQLAIVSEVAGRVHPRVLLADEVGLGKTIEACLILHGLHLTGRADRVLILVPEPLVHQWFVELLRRFNLLFALFDEPRCESIETHDPLSNPFLDSQLILAATDFLASHPDRAEQAKSAGFDLLIVDEAHHLAWSPEAASPGYEMVQSLAESIPSLLLLTATPQQLGPAGHFARLRLLDPDRYPDLDAFLAEAESYTPLADAVVALKSGTIPDSMDHFAADSPRVAEQLASLRAGNESARSVLIADLVDTFGTGRVLFRNTRERLKGFPKRIPHLHPLAKGASPYTWLAQLMRDLPEQEKVLLITSSPEAAMAVQEKLLAEIQVESALFHEDLTLLQRDRNAAWFADPEGARILICSEIGSEGRNFQFARQLVLFGLPRDPELLEQRIGRLDRIGQTGDIHIHIPYGEHSKSEFQARWLHEGLDAFSAPLKGATTLATTLLPELEELEDIQQLPAFLKRSQDFKASITRQLATGHDLLLELGAPPAEKAKHLRQAIESSDSNIRFEKFVLRLFDFLGLDVSDLSHRSHHFNRGQRQSEAFADLPEDGLSATFDRNIALAREDLAMLTPDHPMFLGALDQLLDSPAGNASFARWKSGKGKSVILECAFVLEVVAPKRLHLDRFLPPTLIRILVDHQGAEVTQQLPTALLQPGDARKLVSQETFRNTLFPKMLAAAEQLAQKQAAPLTQKADKLSKESLEAAILRLQDLAVRNSTVSSKEIDALHKTRDESIALISKPRIRLDSLRLIWKD